MCRDSLDPGEVGVLHRCGRDTPPCGQPMLVEVEKVPYPIFISALQVVSSCDIQMNYVSSIPLSLNVSVIALFFIFSNDLSMSRMTHTTILSLFMASCI